MDTSNRRICNAKFCIKFPLIILGVFAMSAVVMLLWNCILPEISPLKALNYWQAMGLFILSKILFGRFGMGSHHKKFPTISHHANSIHFREKFMEMNEDERQQFKNQWKQRCCKSSEK